MLNSSQFSGGPNPVLMAVGALQAGLKTAESIGEKRAKLKRLEARVNERNRKSSQYNDAMILQKHTIPTPENTGAPVPKKSQRVIPTPANTGAPMPGALAKKTSIHPITGQPVPPVPVKRPGKKPTPPGTKPKRP